MWKIEWKEYACDGAVFLVSDHCIMVCLPIKDSAEYVCAFTVERCADGLTRIFRESYHTEISGYSGLTLNQIKFLLHCWKDWEGV